MPLNQDRLMTEISTLADLCEAVDYDFTAGQVVLHGYPLPDGWNRETSRIWFDLEETYPAEQPDVYVPEGLRYHGQRPRIMMKTGPGEWNKYCIHRLHDWEPRRHTLVTLTRMIDTSLENPDSKNPLEDD